MASKYIFPAGIRNPDYPLDEQLADPTLRSEYEDGSQQTRPKFTRIRKILLSSGIRCRTRKKSCL